MEALLAPRSKQRLLIVFLVLGLLAVLSGPMAADAGPECILDEGVECATPQVANCLLTAGWGEGPEACVLPNTASRFTLTPPLQQLRSGSGVAPTISAQVTNLLGSRGFSGHSVTFVWERVAYTTTGAVEHVSGTSTTTTNSMGIATYTLPTLQTGKWGEDKVVSYTGPYIGTSKITLAGAAFVAWTSDNSPPPPPPPQPAAVVASFPELVAMNGASSSRQPSAVVLDQYGKPMPGVTVDVNETSMSGPIVNGVPGGLTSRLTRLVTDSTGRVSVSAPGVSGGSSDRGIAYHIVNFSVPSSLGTPQAASGTAIVWYDSNVEEADPLTEGLTCWREWADRIRNGEGGEVLPICTYIPDVGWVVGALVNTLDTVMATGEYVIGLIPPPEELPPPEGPPDIPPGALSVLYTANETANEVLATGRAVSDEYSEYLISMTPDAFDDGVVSSVLDLAGCVVGDATSGQAPLSCPAASYPPVIPSSPCQGTFLRSSSGLSDLYENTSTDTAPFAIPGYVGTSQTTTTIRFAYKVWYCTESWTMYINAWIQNGGPTQQDNVVGDEFFSETADGRQFAARFFWNSAGDMAGHWQGRDYLFNVPYEMGSPHNFLASVHTQWTSPTAADYWTYYHDWTWGPWHTD